MKSVFVCVVEAEMSFNLRIYEGSVAPTRATHAAQPFLNMQGKVETCCIESTRLLLDSALLLYFS